MNPRPTSATHRATSSGPRSMRTPSASSTSALPEALEAARWPCLATGALAALERQCAMTHAHDDAVVAARAHGKFVRQRGLVDRERVVSRRDRRRRDPAKKTFAVVTHGRRLAVSQRRRPRDPRAEGSTDALMSEAHPKRRNAITAERPDRLAGHACLAWITRARRHDHAARAQREQRLDRDLVIASHDDVGPERSGELDQV